MAFFVAWELMPVGLGAIELGSSAEPGCAHTDCARKAHWVADDPE